MFDPEASRSRPVLPTTSTTAASGRELVLQRLRRWWAPAALGVVLVVATVLRVYDIGANPPGFFTDEASYGYNAYTILHTGRDEYGARLPLFFKAFGEYKMPVYIYSQVPLIAVLGLSELPVRLTSALYGVLTVLALFLLVRELFKNDGMALAAAAILAVSPWSVHYNRTGLGEVTTHAFFLVLALYLFLVSLRRPAFLIASAIAFVVAIYSYRSAWVLTPPLLAVLALLYHRELIRSRRYTLIAVLVLAVAVIPIITHLTTGTSDRSKEQSVFSLDLSTGDTIEKILHGYRAHFTPGFLFNGTKEQPNLRHVIPDIGWVYRWQVPFLVLGFSWLLWKPSRAKVVVISLLAIFPLPSSFSLDAPQSARAFFGTVAFSAITACGIGAAAQWLTSRQQTRWTALTGGALAATILAATAAAGSLQFSSFAHTYYGKYARNATDFWGWQWGSRQIIEHFRSVEDQYDRLLMEAAFNAPEELLRFYAPHGCDTCAIGNWDGYEPSTRQLFALRPGSAWLTYDYDVKSELFDPQGKLAFVFVEITGKRYALAGNAPNIDASFDSQGHPTQPRLMEANGEWKSGAFDQAMNSYNAAIAAAPDVAIAYYNRGNGYATIGLFSGAVNDYLKAIELDPNFAEAINNLGNAYIQWRDYERAKEQLDKVIEQHPNFALARANRGELLRIQKQYDAALADLDAAVQLDPKLAIAYSRRAAVERALGNVATARADYDRAIEMDPSFAEAYAGRGDLLRQRGQHDQAMTDLNKAVELDRDYALAYARRGIAAIYTGDPDLAVADLAKAVELDRDYGRAPSDARNPLWRVGDDAQQLAADLRGAASRVSDQSIVGRLTEMIDYLSARKP